MRHPLWYLKPFTGFPLPPSHVLACPHCDKWKMYPKTLAGVEGFQCAGPASECGKFMTKTEVELLVGQMMVEE